ncbi:MAG: hypothetical protein LQ341_002855 [Variospora aurantia]|nr:MAG: hypothetical protein LQ341_002855 [Variospora aurantia]
MNVYVAQAALQYAAPGVVLLYYIGAIAISLCTLQKGQKQGRSRSHQIIRAVIAFVLVTYIIQSALLLADSFALVPKISSVAANVNAISSALLWSVLIIVLRRTKRPIWYPYSGSWLITLALEIPLFSVSASQLAVTPPIQIVLYATWAGRSIALLGLLAMHTATELKISRLRIDEEAAPLLNPKIPPASSQNQSYGSIAANGDAHAPSSDLEDSEGEDEADKKAKKKRQLVTERLKKDGNWLTYLQGFSVFIPLIWPSRRPRLYLNMVGCGVCVLCARVLQIAVPYQMGIIVDTLTSGKGSVYKAIGLYILLRWAQSYSGIAMIESLLWQPIQQHSYTTITTAAYNQIMELSIDFHNDKQSGELYKAITQGSSITDLLEMAVFQIGPMAIDVVVGFWYLNHLFGPYMALIALATTISYLSITTYYNVKQTKIRREYLELARTQNQVMYDTVGSWTTVSYFNRIPYEEQRYEKAVKLYSARLLSYSRIGYLYRAICKLPLESGMCCALLLAAYQIKHGAYSVGDFVILLTYWSVFTGGLKGPMTFFAHAHQNLLNDLVDAERLLQVLQHKRKVIDGPRTFELKGGAVEFKDVGFSYDGRKQIIQHLSFTAQPGQKIALIGETGGGKSTLLKLLFRFYDVTAGTLLIDGQDVREVTLESLRSHIGVVPQDPSMFNDTVMNNVRYSRLDATDEEVMQACKAAAVHEKVMSFTDGYSSIVGEKGVKLSGGELQRLAIARAILKDPGIILLDEATSSVDTDTESQIQKALFELTKGRTTITVAHRLSTVVDADIILVIKDGTILEQGPPKQLLVAKGKYYDLWCKQVGISFKAEESKADKAADEREAPKEVEQARPGSREQQKQWRPDAPEFVPRQFQGHVRSNTQRQQPMLDLATGTGGDTTRKGRATNNSTTTGEPSQGKRRRAREGINNATTTTCVEGATDKADNNVAEIVANDSDGIRKRTRLNRARRRNMSKSEPTGSSMSTGEGAIDADAAPEGPEGTQAPERRRVSAPSNTPSGDSSKAAVQGRRSRRKQWRVRHPGSSQPLSETQSARTSGTWSSEPGLPEDSAPTTSPVEKNENGEDPSGNQGKGNVRFARDA